ncbi:hypothetical protein ARMGADRAFT_292329 [Armillaria gallica]|uniref:Uncharacterized protein n=1 Tax=Armillaria gallica TaxID=47427 RepID=A0A2H3D690_ARMGA|nr:hypothetical protein ARMGADRAFT_292329 [Armillaria gallica]
MCSVVLGWFWILGKYSLFQKRRRNPRCLLPQKRADCEAYSRRSVSPHSMHRRSPLVPWLSNAHSCFNRCAFLTSACWANGRRIWLALSPRMASNIMHHGARQR